MFLEGAFRLPLTCPTLRQHGDHWIGLCTPTSDTGMLQNPIDAVKPQDTSLTLARFTHCCIFTAVIAGSLHGIFCAFSIVGRALLQRWEAPYGLRLLKLHFSSEGALWTIESGMALSALAYEQVDTRMYQSSRML